MNNPKVEEEGLISRESPQRQHTDAAPSAPSSASSRWGRYTLIVWLAVLLVTVTFWALFVTILVMDMGQACTMDQSEAFQTRIQFTASPTLNSEHYKQLAAVGKATAPYLCTYRGRLAKCYNEESDNVFVDIWFTPMGPLYQFGGQDSPNGQHELELRTWPFGAAQFNFN